MKKSRRKNILRSIRSSLNRFLSILFIVALGSGFLAGLFAASPDMYDTGDRYMDDYRLYDIDLKAPLGFDDDDLDALAGFSDAETLMPAHVRDLVLRTEDDITYTSRVYAALDEDGASPLNQFRLSEGRLPAAPDECLMQEPTRYEPGRPKPGDRLIVDDTENNPFCSDVLTIVGYVESPISYSVEKDPTSVGSGSIALHLYAPLVLCPDETYSDVYLSVRGARELNTFEDDYDAMIDKASDTLRDIGKKRTDIRIDDLRAELEDRLRTIGEMEDTIVSLSDTAYDMALDTAERLPLHAYLTGRIAASGTPYSAALAGLLAKTGESIKETLEAAQKQDTASAPSFDEAKETIADTMNALDDIPDWIVRTREDQAGFTGYRSNVGKVAALSKIFPVFFFLVALLVALTTMTRLVEENRTQIGIMKALGFSGGNVLGEYLLFSMSSSVLGCILGFLAGFRLFPAAISGAYSMMYVLPKTVTPFRPQIALLAGSVTIGSILAATLWACWGEFRAAPAELLVPKAPAAGKRIWMEYITPLWRRIPFTHKVTFRNLFRYKKRFFMTVVGVAGCSALLVTGFGLRDSIRDIVDLQFGEINRFELTIMTDDAEYAAAPDGALGELLSSAAVTGALPVFEESGKAEANGEGGSVTILVPSRTGDLDTFLSLRERKSGTALPLTDGGVILTEKLCETMGISVGDAVTIENNDGKRAETHLIGIAENYITAYAYLSPACYEELFGSAPACTTLLCTLASDADTDRCITAALEDEHAFYAGSSRSIKETFADSIKSIDAVVFVLIAASGLLSMVVLYNLTNVNICERRKELATIRVLGFHENETERYIFRETNLLSFIGAFVGLFVGIWLHSYVVRTVEVEQVMFGRTIAPLSYVYAMLISIVFTLIVNRIMRRQVRSVDMVEAMKAND